MTASFFMLTKFELIINFFFSYLQDEGKFHNIIQPFDWKIRWAFMHLTFIFQSSLFRKPFNLQIIKSYKRTYRKFGSKVLIWTTIIDWLFFILLVRRLRVARVTGMYQRYSGTLSEDLVLEKYNVTQREKYGTRRLRRAVLCQTKMISQKIVSKSILSGLTGIQMLDLTSDSKKRLNILLQAQGYSLCSFNRSAYSLNNINALDNPGKEEEWEIKDKYVV